MEDRPDLLIKVLSPNDLGLTGGHQAGIFIPRDRETLAFFPALDASELNPRVSIPVSTDEGISRLTYIYYNGKLHDTSTRNEYRLTGLTRYFRDVEAQVGDQLEFSRVGRSAGDFAMRIRKAESKVTPAMSDGDEMVVLTGKWRTIRRARH